MLGGGLLRCEKLNWDWGWGLWDTCVWGGGGRVEWDCGGRGNGEDDRKVQVQKRECTEE